jgi:hypothetical protein
VRRPYGLYVHGNSDTTGAVRAIEAIARGLQWRRAQAPVTVLGNPGPEDLKACWELGAAMAAGAWRCRRSQARQVLRPSRPGASASTMATEAGSGGAAWNVWARRIS